MFASDSVRFPVADHSSPASLVGMQAVVSGMQAVVSGMQAVVAIGYLWRGGFYFLVQHPV
jgi:hypothetical protein